MGFDKTELTSAWEAIFGKESYIIRLAELRDGYPDKKSLLIPYGDLEVFDPELASELLERPDDVLAAAQHVLRKTPGNAWLSGKHLNIRVIGLPRDAKVDVRDIRTKHLGRLIAVEGMVRKATVPKPRLISAIFTCTKCGVEIEVPQGGMYIKEPKFCVTEGCNSASFSINERKSKYIDAQRIEIQENPEGLRGGAQPERMIGHIDDDIAGTVAPGNRIVMNGILRSLQKMEREKSTIYETYLEVQSVEFEQSDFSELEITDEDEDAILKAAADPHLMEKIVRSISPTIYGMDMVKQAVALQLFGGSHKLMDDGASLRGDIHILLIGDPGVAKSQILRYMSSLSPRGIYASGKSASAAGLCVHGDTELLLNGGRRCNIGEFVESRMKNPEEYRPGIWRSPIEEEKIMSMFDIGSLRLHPISYVWKIKTPDKLIKISTSKNSLILTPETKIMAMQGSSFDWIEAEKISEGDFVGTYLENMRMFPVISVETLTENLPEYVYDLTVEPSHSFVGNGFLIHNTAAAVKDDFGDGRWTLEAGALVLADKGLACIDELDKMSDQDRSSLHEAMESQKISIAKAGITATLQCRCSMLAAANPKFGRFDDTATIVSQIDLPPALMSRFDLMFILTDKPDSKRDAEITDHILGVHRRGQALLSASEGIDVDNILESTKDIVPPYDVQFLRKYVAYAKKNVVPVMTDDAMSMIKDNYLNIRQQGEDGSMPITARQLEAYIRLAEASAKMHLRKKVTREDAQNAINLISYYLNSVARTSNGGLDIDLAGGAVNNKQRQQAPIIKEIIAQYSDTGGITMEELIQQAEASGIAKFTVESIVKMLKSMVEITENKNKLRLV